MAGMIYQALVAGAPRLLRAALEPSVTLVATRARPERFARLHAALVEDGRISGGGGGGYGGKGGGGGGGGSGGDGGGGGGGGGGSGGGNSDGGARYAQTVSGGGGVSVSGASGGGAGDVSLLLMSDSTVGAARRMLERLRLARLRGVAAGGAASNSA